MSKSFKIVGGKLVRRTKAESAKVAKMWAEFDKKEAANKAKSRIPRSTERYIKITASQLVKLSDIKFDPTAFIFFVIMYEANRNWGKPFIFPAEKLQKHGGADEQGICLRTQREVLARLEKAGLISVQRQPPKQPVITVL
jgi:hypothetical protein